MSFNEGLLPITAEKSLKAFELKGAFYNHETIQNIIPFEQVGMEAAKFYNWDFAKVGLDIIPLTLWGFKNSGVANNDSLIIKILDGGNEISIELAGNKNILGNAFYFNFPLIIVNSFQIAKIKSSVPLDLIKVYAKMVKSQAPIGASGVSVN